MPAANKGPSMWSSYLGSTCFNITLKSSHNTHLAIEALVKIVPFQCTCVFVDKDAQVFELEIA